MSIKEDIRQAVIDKAGDIAKALCSGHDVEIRKAGRSIKVLEITKKTVIIPE